LNRVLLVEDDIEISKVNENMLKLSGYDARAAINLSEAGRAVAEYIPDIIVLDIMLPDGNGLDFLRDLRGRGYDTPVLLLTALGEPGDELKGFIAGGDDYLSKPYHYDIFMARIAALLRRAGHPPEIIKKGALTLHILACRADVNGVDLSLQKIEFALLYVLVKNENTVVAAEELYSKVWVQPMAGDRNALQVAVSRVRKKIEPSGYSIDVLRRQGYIFRKKR